MVGHHLGQRLGPSNQSVCQKEALKLDHTLITSTTDDFSRLQVQKYHVLN